MAQPAVQIKSLTKRYKKNNFLALDNVDLTVNQGEIFALLGPNGAGKTTLIGSICGTVQPTHGSIDVFGYDNIRDYKKARSHIGLVPQELTTNVFETVWNSVNYTRGLFGKKKDPALMEDILKRLSLWEKKDNQARSLSGGMKRRLMIAKALSHEPKILFLDEPTSGVDVELRQSMWEEVRKLKNTGVTIFLTTHYIEEAEEMADRVAVINSGKIILVEKKDELIQKMGNKQMIFQLDKKLEKIPKNLQEFHLELADNGKELVFTYCTFKENNNISNILDRLQESQIRPYDIYIRQSKLEDIFIDLVKEEKEA